MAKEKCPFKHTPYQATDQELWKCPQCQAGPDAFYITDSPNEECDLVHMEDNITCYDCGYGGTGRTTMKKMMARDHRGVCPTCKGEGTIPKDVVDA